MISQVPTKRPTALGTLDKYPEPQSKDPRAVREIEADEISISKAGEEPTPDFRAAIDRDPHAVDVYFEWPTSRMADTRDARV